MPKVIKRRAAKIPLREEKAKSTHAIDLSFLGRNLRGKRKEFILLLSALIIAISVFFGFKAYATSLSKKAYSLEMEAYNHYYGMIRSEKDPLTAEERWKKALELYRESFKIKPTSLRQFYIGNCYYKLNDYSNAINAYKVLIDKYPEEGLLPLAYQRLSSSYIKVGNIKDALKTLEILKNFKNGAFKDSALIEEARLYEAQDMPQDAQKKYEELLKEFPASPWSAEAKSKLKGKPS